MTPRNTKHTMHRPRFWFGAAVAVLLFTHVPATAIVAASGPPPADPATDWKRSKPDVVVYLPKGGSQHDGDNEMFIVFKAPKSDELLGMWTQSSVEGRGDRREMHERVLVAVWRVLQRLHQVRYFCVNVDYDAKRYLTWFDT